MQHACNMKPGLRGGAMAKMREVILGQSESDVQRNINEWQQRTAGKVSEVEWRVERIEQPQGHLAKAGKLRFADTHMMIVKYKKKAPSKNPRR